MATNELHGTSEELTDFFSDDAELIDNLKRLSKTSPKLIRSSEYQAPALATVSIQSWKMNEFKYYDIPSPFPTLARGLFTQAIKTSSGGIKDRIVIRGYDKFFNIGEVPWTKWESLETHTAPPYTLTLKSNGCIIFIAALTPTRLLVTSKHALGGPVRGSNANETHAQVGERWLRKHLADAGKSEEQLARTLWAKRWTAVAELCDDSFEEHVLPYGPEKTGLHLHGLNIAAKRFETQEQDVVDAFAREWGFITTPSTVLHSIAEVKSFTTEVGASGCWNGEAVEGFVVRTHVTSPPTDNAHTSASASPYPPGSSFFFKVKFDEPYMMYRDWREVTKQLLSRGANTDKIAKSKLRRPETKLYVRWVSDEIKRDSSQFADFTKGKGIIATRERFLRWMESDEGKQAHSHAQAIPKETGLHEHVDLTRSKIIIMPVAIPGVGKTAIAVALAYLFGFDHVQSDNVRSKKTAPTFLKNVTTALKAKDVVIADKNNHLKQHREQLRAVANKFNPPAKLLALNWSFELPLATIHRICGDRIVGRGERHQTLVADRNKGHEDVVWQFLRDSEELADSEADVAVTMDVEESFEDAVARAVGAVVKYIALPQPDREKIGEALAAARAYESEQHQHTRVSRAARVKTDDGRPKPPRYFAMLPELDLADIVGAALAGDDVPKEAKAFWEQLVKGMRVQTRPHITLVHSKSLPDSQELWNRCLALDALEQPPFFNFSLGHVVGNDRVIAVTVGDVAAEMNEAGEAETEAVRFLVQMPVEVRERLHITVGTKVGVLPVESMDVMTRWKSERENGGIWTVPLRNMWAKGRLKGLFQ